MQPKEWYLKAGSKQVGPMTADRVRQRMAAGKIPAKTRAWREGMDEWGFVRDIPELASDDDGEPDRGGAEVCEKSTGRRRDSHRIVPKKRGGAPILTPEKRATHDDKAPTKSGAKTKTKTTASTKKGGAIAPKAAVKAAPRSGGGGIRGALFPEKLPLTFEQPYRLERSDVTGAFGLALSGPRVKLLTVSMFVATLIALAPLAAAILHPLLGLLVALPAAPAAYVFLQIAMGALSYQTRRQIESGETPSVSEALGWAKSRAIALTVTPVVVCFLAGVPIVALAVLLATDLIPVVGPIFNGLIFGVHLVLSAAALFLAVASCLIWAFGPIIVAFEGTGIGGTIQVLFDLVRRSAVRLVLWALWPTFVYVLFALIVVSVAAVVIGVPLMGHVTLGGGSSMIAGGLGSGGPGSFDESALSGFEDAALGGFDDSSEDLGGADSNVMPEIDFGSDFALPASGSGMGWGVVAAAVPTVLWCTLAVAIVFAILASAQNAILCLLYLGGRKGNDDLVSRETWLAARANEAEAG